MEHVENRVLIAATAFTTVAVGCLAIACIVPVLGIRDVQLATKLQLTADAHRMVSLAKTYDAKAAVLAMKTLSDGIN